MKCLHCGNELPDNSAICGFCGKPQAPEGFEFDEPSGFYKKIEISADEAANTKVKTVTWFDHLTGRYSQEIHQLPDESAPIVTEESERQGEEIAPSEPETEPQGEEPAPAEPETEPQDVEPASAEPENAPQDAETAPSEPENVPQGVEPAPAEPENAPQDAETAPNEPEIEPQDVEPAPAEPENVPQDAEPAPAEPEIERQAEEIAPNEPENVPQYVDWHTKPDFAVDIGEQDETGEQQKPRRKHKGLIVFLIIVILLLVVCAAGYLGYLDKLKSVLAVPVIANIVEPPQGAQTPSFSQEESVALIEEDIEEAEDTPELPALQEPVKDEAVSPASGINFYTTVANVSAFYTGAGQDEDYVYYLSSKRSATLNEPCDLMRVDPSNPVPEPVLNLWAGTNSIYSFALYEDSIIVCARQPGIQGYGFFKAGKTGGEPELMFERDMPALINVHEDNLYFMFNADRSVVRYNPHIDSEPLMLDIPVPAESASYYEILPQFSVVDGYIYYGIAYQKGEFTDYYRFPVAGGESELVLSGNTLGERWVENPLFDTGLTAFYAQYDYVSNAYMFKICKPGAAPEIVMTSPIPVGMPPVITYDGSKNIVAELVPESLCMYDVTAEQPYVIAKQIAIIGSPYAVTQDYLVTETGLYGKTDLNWIPFKTTNAG